MTFAPIPSPEETHRLYSVGELGPELARHHETATGNEEAFITQCVSLHNKGEIDLLSVASTPLFASIQGHKFFIAQHFYCEAIPELCADVRALMLCCSTLIKQAGQDGAATQPNGAFQKWCVSNPGSAREIIDDAREGDELAKQFVTFALRSLNDIDEATAFAKTFRDERRLFGITALAGMKYDDKDEAHKAIAVLKQFISAGIDDDVRLSALRAAFDILKAHPDLTIATNLVDASVKEPGQLTLHALAQVVWLHHSQLGDAAITTALRALRLVSPESLGTVNILDLGLAGLLGTTYEGSALDCLTDILRDSVLTLANFDTTTHALNNGDSERLYSLIIRWLLSGHASLSGNVGELIGVERDRSFNTSAASLGLTSAQEIFVSRKAIGFLFFKPVVCCSIIVSVLRSASPETKETLAELLFDPILLNYGGDAKDYLKSITPSDAAYSAVQVALETEASFHKGLDTIGTVKELFPSDYQHDVVRQRMYDEMREIRKLAENQSALMNLMHRSTLLYGNRSLTYITDPGGQQRAVKMDLKSVGTSFELPRHEILDPVGLDYKLRVFRVEKLK